MNEGKLSLKDCIKIERGTEIVHSCVMGTSRKFKNKRMSGVEIDIEIIHLSNEGKIYLVMERPINVRGIVLPCKTNKRKLIPQPIAFNSLTKYVKTEMGKSKFKMISPHSDRGHLFALELGGPNTQYNIIPQWAGFQESGDWRKFEQEIKKDVILLSQHQNSLYYEINIEYMNLLMDDLQGKLFEIFNFRSPLDFTQDKVLKCLQIFGMPVQYSSYTYPCNIFLKKPRNHSLSISYIKHLYELSRDLYNTGNHNFDVHKLKVLLKMKKNVWTHKRVSQTNFLNYDKNIFSKEGDISHFCKKSIFLLSQITEQDL